MSLLVLSSILSAQSRVIKGTVLETATRLPLEFVSVSVLRAKDSTQLKSAVTDKDGKFFLSVSHDSAMLIKCNMIGFLDQYIPIKPFGDTIQLPSPIHLVPSENLLGVVNIEEEKSVFVNGIDRKIYNVAQDLQSSSGSASAILENIPSVTVDIDGNVSLLGSGNVTIFINGKPSPMMRTNAAAALQQIPANMIERIEIITNPSAKYKPDGTAGIINIVLKKNSKLGFHGILTLNAGPEERYNGSLNFNYKPGKFNYFGSYSYRHDRRGRTSRDERQYFDSTGAFQSYEFTERDLTAIPNTHMATLGFDFSPDTMNELGLSGYAQLFNVEKEEQTLTGITDAANVYLLNTDRSTTISEDEWEVELESYFLHRFKKKDHEINVELSGADHFESEDNYFNTAYIVPSIQPVPDHFRIRQREKQLNGLVEYTNPVGEDMELVAGYEPSILHQDFEFLGQYYDASQSAWTDDTIRTRSFKFSQQNHAFFTTFEFPLGDLGVLLGARLENTRVVSHLVQSDSTIPNDYTRFYPTAHLMYEIADGQELKLSYSRRVNRPEGDELNPFILYTDPRNAEVGNPYLLPEQMHSLELGYSLGNKKITFTPTLYYRYTFDAFTEVAEYMNDSVMVTRFENLATDQNTGLELVLNTKIKKLVTIMWSGTAYYNVIDASNLGYSTARSAWSWDSKMSIKITAWKNGSMQFNPYYRSATVTPQGKNLDMFALDGGARQEFLKGQLAVTFSISDMLKTRRWAYEAENPYFKQQVVNKRKSQFFYVGISWKFGKTKMKSEELKFDDKL